MFNLRSDDVLAIRLSGLTQATNGEVVGLGASRKENDLVGARSDQGMPLRGAHDLTAA